MVRPYPSAAQPASASDARSATWSVADAEIALAARTGGRDLAGNNLLAGRDRPLLRCGGSWTWSLGEQRCDRTRSFQCVLCALCVHLVENQPSIFSAGDHLHRNACGCECGYQTCATGQEPSSRETERRLPDQSGVEDSSDLERRPNPLSPQAIPSPVGCADRTDLALGLGPCRGTPASLPSRFPIEPVCLVGEQHVLAAERTRRQLACTGVVSRRVV